MFRFIPADIYASVFFNVLLLIVVATFFRIIRRNGLGQLNYELNNFFGIILVLSVTLYIGYRPISSHFGDMMAYAHTFNLKKYGLGTILDSPDNDQLFDWLTNLCVKYLTQHQYFVIIAILYVIPLYFASKKLFKEQWFFGFLMLITTMSFWSYGTNGLRNGMATSIFILALAYHKSYFTIILMIASIAMHRSMILPTLAYCLTLVVNNPKYYFIFWLSCIPVSFVAGGFFEQLFISIDLVSSDRIINYLGGTKVIEYKSGFRWDFLLYSSAGVFAGWYFIYKININDKFYHRLFNVYLFANAFWILIIRAPFSNRFAYLSWFMISIVLIYPLLKYQVFKKQSLVVGQILLANFAFTYILISIIGV